jgi:23S rRNA pseudoU1915 N3-methylase RlmH
MLLQQQLQKTYHKQNANQSIKFIIGGSTTPKTTISIETCDCSLSRLTHCNTFTRQLFDSSSDEFTRGMGLLAHWICN